MKKTVLVTGASRGIGRDIASVFAADGYNVVINYNNSRKAADDLAALLNANGFSAASIKADVSDRAQVEDMIKKAGELFGGVDVLVNNAGISRIQLFTDIKAEEWERMLAVNVTGMFNCCQCVLPYMIRKQKGKIINISSIWGVTGASCEVAYSASKAAVIGFTKALAKEMGPSGIQVNCVAPGIIDTEMNAELDDETVKELKENTPLGVFGSPRDISETVMFLASGKADFITGQVIGVNGGFVI